MPFNSFEYIVFFCVILSLSCLLHRWKLIRLWMLLLASWYFYASNNHKLILLLLLTTQVDYICALRIEKSNNVIWKKFWLIVPLASNLAVLGYFKYFNFFTGAGWEIALPIGISFYTFEAMGYAIDVYRGQMKAERSWLRYCSFIAFFPHLVAGPIIRAKDFLPQLDRDPSISIQDMDRALYLIFKGLFKKMVLADFLAVQVDKFFLNPGEAGTWVAWVGVYGFAFQIYYDFCGYTDIAVGCGKLLGFDLPVNFNYPYAAKSLTDFWRRWHITLSKWLRENLYFSLGGSRRGLMVTVRNLLITMLLGGLWHGAAWTFVLWGALHGILLAAEHVWRDRRSNADVSAGFFGPASVFVTFNFVCLSWILFRAKGMENAGQVVSAMCRWNWNSPVTVGSALAGVICLAGITKQLCGDRIGYKQFGRLPVPVRSMVFAVIVTLVTVMAGAGSKPFIYFNF